MGLFDKMFGRGSKEAEEQPNAQQRFDELRNKYQSVLTTADQQHIQFHHLHVQGADTGADLDFLKGCRGAPVGKDSH